MATTGRLGYTAKGRDALEDALAQLKELDLSAQEVGPTSFAGISEDPRLREAQLMAMEQLLADAQAGGLSAGDLARIQEANIQGAQMERGQRDALAQQFAARGQAGSGFNQAQALLNQQAGADRRSAQQRAITSQAEQLALQKMMAGQGIAGGVRQADYAQNAQQAQAQDLINRYNAQLAGDAQQRQLQSIGAQQGLAGGFLEAGAQRRQNIQAGLEGGGQVVGGLAKAFCHGAAEYYPWHSPEWTSARNWIAEGWPKVSILGKIFKAFYSRYSKQVAWCIRKSSAVKAMLEPFFNWCVKNGR